MKAVAGIAIALVAIVALSGFESQRVSVQTIDPMAREIAKFKSILPPRHLTSDQKLHAMFPNGVIPANSSLDLSISLGAARPIVEGKAWLSLLHSELVSSELNTAILMGPESESLMSGLVNVEFFARTAGKPILVTFGLRVYSNPRTWYVIGNHRSENTVDVVMQTNRTSESNPTVNVLVRPTRPGRHFLLLSAKSPGLFWLDYVDVTSSR